MQETWLIKLDDLDAEHKARKRQAMHECSSSQISSYFKHLKSLSLHWEQSHQRVNLFLDIA